MVTKRTLYVDKETLRKHVTGRKFQSGLQRRVKQDRKSFVKELKNMKQLGKKILVSPKARRDLSRGYCRASLRLKKYSLRRMPKIIIE